MGDTKEPNRDAIALLLELSADIEQTPEEATEELRAKGVNVDGFLAQARKRRANHAEQTRTAWLRTARAGIERVRERRSSRYDAMGRGQLVAEFKRREGQQAQAFFHKLDEIKDDDLRTLLVDLDDLEDGPKDPT